MKYALFILFTLFALHVECGRRKKFEPEETCATELHLRKSKMKFIVNEINTPEDNSTYGEFFFCVFNKRNIMDENGMINEVYFRNFLKFVFHGGSNGTETEKANVNRVFDICIRSTRDNKLKTAINLKNCISRYIQELETDI